MSVVFCCLFNTEQGIYCLIDQYTTGPCESYRADVHLCATMSVFLFKSSSVPFSDGHSVSESSRLYWLV